MVVWSIAIMSAAVPLAGRDEELRVLLGAAEWANTSAGVAIWGEAGNREDPTGFRGESHTR